MLSVSSPQYKVSGVGRGGGGGGGWGGWGVGREVVSTIARCMSKGGGIMISFLSEIE